MSVNTTRRQLGSIGVICHVMRPTLEECADLAAAAEDAGAGFCTFPDALGWRDAWLILGPAAAATERIVIGPGLTNPYTRHPFITLAALATFHEMSGGRSLFGIAAGGSELTALAGIDRSDSPEQVRAIVDLLRRAARGDSPVPFALPIPDVPVVGGGRGPRMLAAVGDCCDVAYVWAQTHDILEKAAATVRSRGAAVAWAPLRTADEAYIKDALVYGVLNSPVATRRELGIDEGLEGKIRDQLMEGGMDRAAALIPDSAVGEFVVGDDIAEATAIAGRLEARHVVVLAFTIEDVPSRVAWAREVAAALPSGSG